MVNILPPELKRQVSYSRRNVKLLRYLTLALLGSGLLAVVLLISLWLSSKQLTELEQSLKNRQQQHEVYKDTEAKVKALQSNLNLIDKLLTEQTQYSTLLGDLAAVLPAGSFIQGMSLTGDDTKPMEMVVSADSFNTAGLVRNALLTSGRIKSADIQSITKDEETNIFSVDIIIAFEKGQAR